MEQNKKSSVSSDNKRDNISNSFDTITEQVKQLDRSKVKTIQRSALIDSINVGDIIGYQLDGELFELRVEDKTKKDNGTIRLTCSSTKNPNVILINPDLAEIYYLKQIVVNKYNVQD